jgi:hypothetical protein
LLAVTTVHTTGINWDAIGVIIAAIGLVIAQIQRASGRIDKRFDQVEQKVKSVDDCVDTRTTQINQTLDQHGNRLTAIEARSKLRREEDSP